MKRTLPYLATLVVLLLLTSEVRSVDEQMYCNGETEDGAKVKGVCLLFSDHFGEFLGETEDGKEVTGSCFKYSESNADLESVETEDGKEVTGECRF